MGLYTHSQGYHFTYAWVWKGKRGCKEFHLTNEVKNGQRDCYISGCWVTLISALYATKKMF